MNLIHEELAMVPVLSPQEIAAGGVAKSNFVDMSGRLRFSFAVQLGAVAAGKAVVVELLSSENQDGSNPVDEGEITFTAPTGGVTSHVVVVSGQVTAMRGRYFGIQIGNGTAAALNTCVLLLAEEVYRPRAAGTTLVV